MIIDFNDLNRQTSHLYYNYNLEEWDYAHLIIPKTDDIFLETDTIPSCENMNAISGFSCINVTSIRTRDRSNTETESYFHTNYGYLFFNCSLTFLINTGTYLENASMSFYIGRSEKVFELKWSGDFLRVYNGGTLMYSYSRATVENTWMWFSLSQRQRSSNSNYINAYQSMHSDNLYESDQIKVGQINFYNAIATKYDAQNYTSNLLLYVSASAGHPFSLSRIILNPYPTPESSDGDNRDFWGGPSYGIGYDTILPECVIPDSTIIYSLKYPSDLFGIRNGIYFTNDEISELNTTSFKESDYRNIRYIGTVDYPYSAGRHKYLCGLDGYLLSTSLIDSDINNISIMQDNKWNRGISLYDGNTYSIIENISENYSTHENGFNFTFVTMQNAFPDYSVSTSTLSNRLSGYLRIGDEYLGNNYGVFLNRNISDDSEDTRDVACFFSTYDESYSWTIPWNINYKYIIYVVSFHYDRTIHERYDDGFSTPQVIAHIYGLKTFSDSPEFVASLTSKDRTSSMPMISEDILSNMICSETFPIRSPSLRCRIYDGLARKHEADILARELLKFEYFENNDYDVVELYSDPVNKTENSSVSVGGIFSIEEVNPKKDYYNEGGLL